jgi:deoxyribodipyrimidine photolyase-related protein
MDIFIIYPVNLFSNIDLLKDKYIYLIEEPRFFIDFNYHKLKLAYHRATMKSYYDYLKNNNIKIEYINYNEKIDELYKKINKITKTSKKKVYIYDPCDNILLNKVVKIIPTIIVENTLNFLINKDLISENLSKFYNKKYNHQNFYKWQRTRLNILIEKDGTPKGGKWSFDNENRKKLPKNINIPKIINLNQNNNHIIEAKNYIETNFKKNYGSLNNFVYPINHEDTKKWLDNFLKNKFENFGPYEDAESLKDPFLYHSVLSPMMNIGLITDSEVIEITLKYENKIPIESFEGFIRQIIGWRNYLYAIYLLEGNNFKKLNFLNHTNRLNKEIMWKGNTNILPIDNVIKKINDFGYAHHIERLMYLGNYMFLCMINPNDVYEIFMEWTIDAYEWVMIPNVYGMSQFSDGGKIMTRPYFSSSNYILKMSEYKKDNWCKIYDFLYYNFINTHQKYLSKNYATSRQVAFWIKKSDTEKKDIIKNANEYINSIKMEK